MMLGCTELDDVRRSDVKLNKSRYLGEELIRREKEGKKKVMYS